MQNTSPITDHVYTFILTQLFHQNLYCHLDVISSVSLCWFGYLIISFPIVLFFYLFYLVNSLTWEPFLPLFAGGFITTAEARRLVLRSASNSCPRVILKDMHHPLVFSFIFSYDQRETNASLKTYISTLYEWGGRENLLLNGALSPSHPTTHIMLMVLAVLITHV